MGSDKKAKRTGAKPPELPLQPEGQDAVKSPAGSAGMPGPGTLSSTVSPTNLALEASAEQRRGPPPLPGPSDPSSFLSGRANADSLVEKPAAAVPPSLPTPGAASAKSPEWTWGPDAAVSSAEPRSQPTSTTEAADETIPSADGRRPANRRPAGPARRTIAANDDIPTIGALIYALEQRPSKRPFTIAAVGSAIWLLLSFLFGWAMLAPELAAAPSWSALLAKPVLLTIAATALIPVAIFWFLALIVWRAQELRLMSSAMTEVAVRLAEPDRSAEQAVSSLGQSVRRQVGFMNDAVAQAINRAGDLEAMVHNEVAMLERTFQENEHRIRGILTELSGERTQLVSTSDDVHKTLRAMADEVPALIEKLTTQQTKLSRIIESAGHNLIALESSLMNATDRFEGSVNDTTARLDGSLSATTERLESTLSSATIRLESGMSAGTERIETTMASAVGQIEGNLSEVAGRIETTLSSQTGHLANMLAEYSEAINFALGERTTQMQSVFEEYTRALDASLSLRSEEMSRSLTHRTEQLDAAMVERTAALDQAFAARVRAFDETIITSTQAIDAVVGDKARALSAAMDAHARTLAETLGRQAVDLDETLMQGIDAVRRTSESITRQSVKAIEGLSGQADMLKNVSENLLMQIGSVTSRFETQGQQIMRAANALETANFRIDNTLQSRHRELTDTLQRLAVKTTEFDKASESHTSSREGTRTAAQNRARSLTSDLANEAMSKAQLALGDLERAKRDTEMEAQRQLADLRGQLGSVNKELNSQFGTLSSRLAETSEELRLQSERAAAELAAEQGRLRREAERLPEIARSTAEGMRQSLSDHMRALDQLSRLSSREASRRDIAPPLPAPTPSRSQRSETAAPVPASHDLTATYTSQQPVAPQSGADPRSRPPHPAATTQAEQPHAQHAPQHAAPVPSAAAAPAGRWSLGDLLARASTDNETAGQAQLGNVPASQQQSPATTINLEVIANALDEQTATAVWARLRAGQRGIMVKSIYSLEGRAVFDEVSRRYLSDPGLRATVDRFLADFDRVLRDGEMRDPHGGTTHAHLVSPSGRVYLFLSHATGRLV